MEQQGVLEIPGLDDQDIAILLNARNYAYYCDMIKQIQSKKCPFCQLDPEKNRVIHTSGDWRIWECPEAFKAKHIAKHFVLAPKRHITHTNCMTDKDWFHCTVLLDWATNGEIGINLPGGGIIMRFGHPDLNAQSIRHLHCNIMVPDGTGEVKITLAKDPKKVTQKRVVVLIFERLRGLGISPNDPEIDDRAQYVLAPSEYFLVKDYLS
ncbi:MAG: hypothetical protein MRY49_01585 [Candidatus Pacebacteria bacterium]|nr:hypothetical protein [Candidatus Paceibacterota bacterium]